MNLFRNRSPEAPKTPPASPPSKRTSKILSRSQSGSDHGSPSKGKAPASAPESPSESPSNRTPLGIANVANIFIKMRRASDQVKKPWDVESSSGEHPQSHPGVLEAVRDPERAPLRQQDTFLCDGAVNLVQLLRATRNALMELAAGLDGANVLVDEQWSCTIHGPKQRPNRTFKVQIMYTASAARSDCPDPHRPIALDKAKSASVPGLMTITKRITE
ncbi:hypothetical protein C8F04DRAFT_957461 [Mycena alexandri]|uniref:Uncharacterized protein n=1 Tax=Mycena alexandri TaxID=1745969 RepID=A0AAD6SKG1_9AGAR|nr:hypothetical protein C8F04DRAFT_963096 [Mycena alexandri]KAJ7033624.1 hypothetical protein C8F04DRAFT_957461 [Mycena alexandri]